MICPTVIVGVDPSILALGIGACNTYGVPRWYTDVSQDTSASEDYHLRAVEMAKRACGHIAAMTEDQLVSVIVECPNNWFTQKGQASKDGEDVQKLYFMAGCLVGMLPSIPSVKEIWCVTPMGWKGQTPKNIVRDRWIAHMKKWKEKPEREATDNAVEALMISVEAARTFRSATDEQPEPGWDDPFFLAWARELLEAPGVTTELINYDCGDE